MKYKKIPPSFSSFFFKKSVRLKKHLRKLDNFPNLRKVFLQLFLRRLKGNIPNCCVQELGSERKGKGEREKSEEEAKEQRGHMRAALGQHQQALLKVCRGGTVCR